MVAELDDVDLFVSRAAAEVVRMYRQELKLPKSARLFEDKTASAVPVGAFYYGTYHTLVVGPATSNTVAKCVFGISDTLVTNVFAQAGKCRVPAIVFACDTAPELETMAPHGLVKVYPRKIDLEGRTYVEVDDMLFWVREGAGVESAFTGNRWTNGIVYYVFDAAVSSTNRQNWRDALPPGVLLHH